MSPKPEEIAMRFAQRCARPLIFSSHSFRCEILDEPQMKPFDLIIGIAMIIILMSCVGAFAQPLPQPKPIGPGGSCGHGWYASGSYCMPSAGAQDAVPLPPNGVCAWGWTRSGSFCLRSGS